MAKTIRPVNGSTIEAFPPVVPVMSQEELLAQLDALKAENQALRQQPRTGTLSLKVSEKGALSAYGLGRFPFTLYAEQWERLLAAADEIKAFMKANASRLSRKA